MATMDSATYKDFGVCLSKFSDYFARWIDGNLMKLEFADMAGLDAQCCEFDVSLQYPKNVSSKGTASEVGYTDGRRVCFGGRPGLARLSSAQPGLARLSSARLGHKMDPTWMEEQTRLPHYGRKFT